MRTLVALVSIALLAACGSKKTEPPAGGGTTSGAPAGGGTAAPAGGGSAEAPAPPAKAAYCVANDPQNTLSAFAADDKTVTFCIKQEGDEKGAPKCTSVDLASGAYTAAAAAPAAPPAPAAALAFKQDDKSVEACKGAACKKLDLPKRGEGTVYMLSVSSDGKRVAAAGGGQTGVFFLDGTTGKKLKTIKFEESECPEATHFLGDLVYIAISNCAGPGGDAVLYSWAGKKISGVGAQEFNSYGADPLSVGGDNYALVGYGGGDILIFNGKTGKEVHMIEVQIPEDCEYCGMVLGDAASWSTSPIAKLSSGKLVTIDGGGVSIIDPATGKLEKTHRMPICPAKK